jgi:hypothetical protein
MQSGTIEPKAPATVADLISLLPGGTTEVINGIVLYDIGDDEVDVEAIVGDLGWVEPATYHEPHGDVDATYYPLALEARAGVDAEEVWGLVQTLKDQGVVRECWRTAGSSIMYANTIGDNNHHKIEGLLGGKALITVLPKAQLLGRDLL